MKKHGGYKEGVDTIVGTTTIFEGTIASESSVRVDGKVKGDIKADGNIYIGKNALVEGNIHAINIELAGTIQGNAHASGTLRILSSSKIFGDIEVVSFVADEGALFRGKCSMIEKDDQSKKSKKTVLKSDYKKSSALDPINEEKKDK